MVLFYTRSIRIRSEYLLQSSHRYISFILAIYSITDPLFWSGIAAAGYHHVVYFNCPKRREHYDDLYGKVLQVVDVNVLSFANHVQALLVVFIRDVLEQPRAAEWLREWWTGPRGLWTLEHAGHAGSNNNMGVEVDWKDMKQLVSALATLATFTGALMKNIRDLRIEHADFLC